MKDLSAMKRETLAYLETLPLSMVLVLDSNDDRPPAWTWLPRRFDDAVHVEVMHHTRTTEAASILRAMADELEAMGDVVLWLDHGDCDREGDFPPDGPQVASEA